MDTFSCTECGRCQDACPAWNTGKALSPKLLIMGLRDQVFAEGPKLLRDVDRFEPSPLVPNAVTDDVVWDCVTCGACVQACPVSIEHVDHIVDLRRNLVMVDSRFPAEAEPMLRDVERAGNPWGRAQTERADWAEQLGVRILEPGEPAPEVLYWVGCAASFDERARTAAESTAKLLQAAGVDFAILGPREALHRRPGAADGQRVPVPGPGRAERGDAQRGGRDEDRRELPALLQHARQRVRRLRRRLRGHAPHRADRRAGRATGGCTPRQRRGARSPTTTPATSRATTTCAPTPRELVAAVGAPVEMEQAAARRRSAAAPAARTCGWRSAAG